MPLAASYECMAAKIPAVCISAIQFLKYYVFSQIKLSNAQCSSPFTFQIIFFRISLYKKLVKAFDVLQNKLYSLLNSDFTSVNAEVIFLSVTPLGRSALLLKSGTFFVHLFYFL